jgi:hypothetical protein
MPQQNIAPRVIAEKKTWAVAFSAANTARDGSGTLVTLVTAAAQGSKIELIRYAYEATTNAGMFRIFLHNGSIYLLVKELTVSAISASGSVAAASGEWKPTTDLIVPTGWTVQVATNEAVAGSAFAMGGDL